MLRVLPSGTVDSSPWIVSQRMVTLLSGQTTKHRVLLPYFTEDDDETTAETIVGDRGCNLSPYQGVYELCNDP
jgi:hypothetical protein